MSGLKIEAFGKAGMAKCFMHICGLFLAIFMFAGALQAQEIAVGGQPRTKVGVFVSLYSAKGPSWWSGSEIGFGHVEIAKRFNDTSKYELFALIEPGIENNPDIKAQLSRFNFSPTLLNATDPEDLKKVDVMVSGNWQVNITWSVLDAITEAVQSGVHLVNLEHFGLIRPAFATGFQATRATWASHMNTDIRNNQEEAKKYKERMTLLFGLENPQFVWHLPYLQWRVRNDNPLFKGHPDNESSSTLGINGLVGTAVNKQPFELVNATLEDQWDGRKVLNKEIDPFSIYRCGKGLTVNISLVGDFKNLGFNDRDDLVKYCADWVVSTNSSGDTYVSRPAIAARVSNQPVIAARVSKSVTSGTTKSPRELLRQELSIKGDYTVDKIRNDFGLPYTTEKFGEITIWYYKISDDESVPFFIKNGALFAYGETFFQTNEWENLIGY